MANGRKEPWEQLGYIAPTDSRVVTEDPFSALMEPDSVLSKWLNNLTAYAKAEEATEKAHQNKMEIRKADTKDATKLAKMQAQQSMAELSERFGHDMTLEQSKIFRQDVETMREQAEKDPHGASSRAESMLLDPKLPPEMRSLLQSSSTLFKQKAERKDQRVALAEEMLKYTSPESALQQTPKEFKSRLIEKFSDGTSKFTIAEQNYYQDKRDEALKQARAMEPYQQKIIASIRTEWENSINTLGNMALSPETFTEADRKLAEQAKEHAALQLSQVLSGRFEDLDPKHASTAKYYEAIVLADGRYKLTDEIPAEINDEFLQRASDAYLKEKGIDRKKEKSLKLEEIREKGITLKARDTARLKHVATGEEKTVEGIKANPMLAGGAWDLVEIKSIALPEPYVTPRRAMGPVTAGITFEPRADFPRSVKEGFELQDSKGTKYKIERIFTEGGTQKAILRNTETGKLLGDPPQQLTYAEIHTQYTGLSSAIE